MRLMAAGLWPSFMSSWWVPALAAGLTIPPLILLYFLKLRRKPQTVASTLLWQRAIEDMQVNAPFQKLRNNLLLILQLLALLLAIAALAQPVLSVAPRREAKMILLIDNSASMSAREADGTTRLERARQEARRIVEAMGRGDRAMVIAFNEEARALGPFTDERSDLRRQIDAIEPTDRRSLLAEAVALAEAHATPAGEAAGAAEGATAAMIAPRIVLLSDGGIADAGEVTLRYGGQGGIEYLTIGEARDNAGIVGIEARRSFEAPGTVHVLVRVRNFGPQAVRADVSLRVEGEVRSVQEANLSSGAPAESEVEENAAAEGSAAAMDMPPEGSATVLEFEVQDEAGGLYEARIERADALPADDVAQVLVAPPRLLRVLLVSPGNVFLDRMRRKDRTLAEWEWMSPQEYERAESTALIADGRSRYDVVVFDDVSTERLPVGNYLFLGGIPLIPGVERGESVSGEYAVDWRDAHAVLRGVALENVQVARARALALPTDAQVLVEGRGGPMLALLRRDGRQYLIQSFGFLDEQRDSPNTSWLWRPGFLVYMANALRFLGGAGATGEGQWAMAGDALDVAAAAGRRDVRIVRPDGRTDTAAVRTSGTAYYARTDRVGTYRVEGAPQGQDRYAVNLCSETESDVAPRGELALAGGTVSGTASSRLVTEPVWRWPIAALLLVITLEWIIYNKRVWV